MKTKAKLKTYEVGYSLTFRNSLEVQARSKKEAAEKLRQIESEEGELDALSGDEDGYKITYVCEKGETS